MVDTVSKNKSRGRLWENIDTLKGHTDHVTAAAVATAAMPNTTKTVQMFDETGTSIGFVAIYANADLS